MIAILENSDTKHFQSSRAISHRHIIVGSPLFIKCHLAICLYTDTVALMSLRLDAYDGTNLSIVLGSRRGDDIHALDVCGLQLLQLPWVLYLLVVDVYFRCPLGKDGEIAVAAFYLWQHRQHIVSSSHIFEYRVLNLYGHSACGHLVLWNLAFDRYTFQHLCFRVYPYSTKFATFTVPIHGLVTDVRDAGQYIVLFNGNSEVTAFV